MIFFFIKGISTYGQSSKTISDEFKIVIPQEKIFVHQNTSFLISGETLYYKVYCLNAETKSLSKISKIAYVEMVGKNNDAIFKHKINLESGIGQGDFFIPTSVASGNYKLIVYTNWMKNSGTKHFFQSDIAIVNPFQSNQNEILKVSESSKNPSAVSKSQNVTNINISSNVNQLIKLELNGKVFAPRKKIVLNFKKLINKPTFGYYSLSVRKIDMINIPERLSAESFTQSGSHEENPDFLSDNQEFYLPELRGELHSGKV